MAKKEKKPARIYVGRLVIRKRKRGQLWKTDGD